MARPSVPEASLLPGLFRRLVLPFRRFLGGGLLGGGLGRRLGGGLPRRRLLLAGHAHVGDLEEGNQLTVALASGGARLVPVVDLTAAVALLLAARLSSAP